MHQEVIGCRTAVDTQRRQIRPAVTHDVHHFACLIRHTLERRPDDVPAVRAPSQTHDCATGSHVPVRNTQTGESGDQVDATGVGHALGQRLGLRGVVDDLQLIAEPLQRSPGCEDRPLERIGRLTEGVATHGGE